MSIRKILVPTMGMAALVATGACNVEQTREGELPDIDVSADPGELPEYDVVKTREGRAPSVDVDVEGGRLPEVEVETADIEVGTREVEVTVPDIDIEMPTDGDSDADVE